MFIIYSLFLQYILCIVYSFFKIKMKKFLIKTRYLIFLILNIGCNNDNDNSTQNKTPRFNFNIKQYDKSPLYNILDKDIFDNKDKVKSEIDGTVQYYGSILKDENNIFNIKSGKNYWIKNYYKDHAIITICNNKKCSRYNKKNITYFNDYTEKKSVYHIDTYAIPFIDLAENNKKKGGKSSGRYGLCCYSCGKRTNFDTLQLYFMGEYDIKICCIENNAFNKLSNNDKSIIKEYLSQHSITNSKDRIKTLKENCEICNVNITIAKRIKDLKNIKKYNEELKSYKKQLTKTEKINKMLEQGIIKTLVFKTNSKEFNIFKFNVDKNKYCHFYVEVKKRSAI